MKVDATICRFPIGDGGARCKRKGRICRLYGDGLPVLDGAGAPYLYCRECWAVMADTDAHRAYLTRRSASASRARLGRRRGCNTLDARYKREARHT